MATIDRSAARLFAEPPRAPRSAFVPSVALYWLVALGAALLTVPTFISLATLSWSTEQGQHAPIVIATGVWLLVNRAATFRASTPGRPFVPVVCFTLSLLGYAIGRITSLIFIEMAALYAVYVTGAVVLFGTGWIRKLWFPLLYFLFALPIPDNVIASATQPLKLAISRFAVELLSALGYSVGRAGVTMQVDQYQMFVATACTGVNSMIGITAISIFYVYLRYAQNWRLALLLVLCIVPIGMFLNFLRVILLVLQTHYLGEASAQSFTHELSGFIMFALAIGLLFAIEAPMQLLARRLGWREGTAGGVSSAVVRARGTVSDGRTQPALAKSASRREMIVGGALIGAAGAIWCRMPRKQIGLPKGVAIDGIIPRSLNGWSAALVGDFVMPEADEELEASVYQDMLKRVYVQGDTRIMMLIAYAKAQTHMLHIHRPEKCYPAAGFVVTSPQPVAIPIERLPPVTGAFMTATSLARTEQVLYWLRIGNEFPVTFAQQHLAIARQNLSGYVPDGALVRLSVIGADADGAREALLRFAESLAEGIGAMGRTLLLGPVIASELGDRQNKAIAR